MLSAAWIANAGMLLAAFAGAYFLAGSLETLVIVRNFLQHSPQYLRVVYNKLPDATMVFAVSAVLLFLTTSTVIVCGMLVGGRRFRSVRAWLLLTALVAGWLGFVTTWPEVYWRGQQRRVAAQLAPVEELARFLSNHWPHEDGDLPPIGPFLAYPKDNPTTLMPLRFTAIPETNLNVSAIERTNDGAIRFELVGEAGSWLEWRPDDQSPRPFVSGLDTRYNPVRQSELAPGWFLVRYQTGFEPPTTYF